MQVTSARGHLWLAFEGFARAIPWALCQNDGHFGRQKRPRACVPGTAGLPGREAAPGEQFQRPQLVKENGSQLSLTDGQDAHAAP